MTILRTLFITLTLSTFAAACGGSSDDSGVDKNKKVTSLSADEKMSFCTWSTATQGGEGKTTMCSANTSVTVHTTAECVSGFASLSSTCMATVSQFEACIRAEAAKPCDGLGSSACEPVIACLPAT